ncbi:MAG TPA: sulfatase-like hydrolase/transferase, partial [Thermoanaerobaculia bacterium]
MRRATFLAVTLLVSAACHREATTSDQVSVSHPSILFVTLDTTRADAIGPEQHNVDTPSFNALAKRGMRFRYAYATVPQTLPSHTSMLTGLYPAGHGVHENSRRLDDTQPIVAERLHAAGYRTAAFVSAFALARRFGLARGFDVYDEDFGAGNAERTAKQTTDSVLAWLAQQSDQPTFLWVHYYDPHYPYTPPEPFRTRYAQQPYYGEVASMDEQLGRLVAAFEQHAKQPIALIITGDHGEGLGDHGEAQHGNLMYQATMHVPLLVVGPDVKSGTNDTPVSTRRIFHTILDFAGIDATNSLKPRPEAQGPGPEVIVAEAMKPFLDYGWQPQVMAVERNQKTILAGRTEVYDVVADPAATHDLAAQALISRSVRAALREYPIPSAAQQTTTNLDDEARRKLASLGYVASSVAPVVRKDAPRPVDMAPLFPILDEAAALFVRGEYAKDIPLLQKILAKDPHNLDAALRLATAYSSLGRNEEAVAAFKRAEAIAPDSQDVRTYLALHYAHGRDWPKAVPLLERIVSESPDRLPPLEALALIRERQGRATEAIELRKKIYTMRAPSAGELAQVGEMEMSLGQTSAAIATFE